MYAYIALFVIVFHLLSSKLEEHGPVVTLILALVLTSWQDRSQQDRLGTIEQEKDSHRAAAEKEKTALLELLKEQRSNVKCARTHFEGELERDTYDQHCDLNEKCKLLEAYRRESKQNNITIFRLSKEVEQLKQKEQKLAAQAMADDWKTTRVNEKASRWEAGYHKLNDQLQKASKEFTSQADEYDRACIQAERGEKRLSELNDKHKKLKLEHQALLEKFNEVCMQVERYYKAFSKRNSDCLPVVKIKLDKREKQNRRTKEQKARRMSAADSKPLGADAAPKKKDARACQQNSNYKRPHVEEVQEEREQQVGESSFDLF